MMRVETGIEQDSDKNSSLNHKIGGVLVVVAVLMNRKGA